MIVIREQISTVISVTFPLNILTIIRAIPSDTTIRLKCMITFDPHYHQIQFKTKIMDDITIVLTF